MTKRKRTSTPMKLLSTRVRATKSTRAKKQTKKLGRWYTAPKAIIAILFVLVFASIGVWQLVGSKAAVIDRGTVAYMQSADGCWLAGRVWDSNAKDCLSKKCRSSSSTWIAKTSTHLAYCSGAIATGVSQSSCTSHGRIYVMYTGCSRRIDQDTTAGARQCRYSSNTYYAPSNAVDYCAIVCSGTQYTATATCPASSTSTTSSSTFNIWDRDSVNYYYKYLWQSGVSVVSGWTGSVSGCNAGTISSSAIRAQINAINFARRANGLDAITGLYSPSATNNIYAQKAALIMGATAKLGHDPPSSWACYTKNGAAAASQSNLAYQSGITPVGAVKAMLDEPGPENYPVGHRRWLFNPPAVNFGFGMTKSASAIMVVGLKTDSTNANPAWVTWPSRGYFPDTLEPAGRWSVTGRASFCFNNATVSVTHNGAAVGVSILNRTNRQFGNPTIAWQMTPSPTGTYTVNVSNVNKWSNGSCSTASTSRMSFSYPVTFFTPY